MNAPSPNAVRPPDEPERTAAAHLGWRLLALSYDLLPVLAVWFAVSAMVLLLHAGHPAAPGSLAGWLELALLWLATGGYAVLSWRHGGQTLGQRAWRLRVIGVDDQPVGDARLWLRYALSLISLLTGGLGFLWSLFEPDRRTWHDIATQTRLVRLPR